jgi:rubrerythrin
MEPSLLDRAIRPIHRWVFEDARRRAMKLLRFAETEADGGRDIARAAERTTDPRLRRLFLRHAFDERRHADLFRTRGRALLGTERGPTPVLEANWLAPGERGLDDLSVDEESDASLLAFLHLSERAAAGRFRLYCEVLDDEETRDVFFEILRDEEFHMSYTQKQLARIAPKKRGFLLWRARVSRLWKAWIRIATALASLISAAVLLVQYFIILPPFALLAKRSARSEAHGFRPAARRTSLKSQY